jgi:DNA-binding LytR/AlgR family response regulator
MPDFNKPIPSYLTNKRNIVRMVLLTAAFALVFINFYEPFGVNVWFDITPWQLLLYSSLITLTGVLVVVFSRILMYYRCKRNPINYWQYFAWVFGEISLMALFYALYIKLFLQDKRFFPDLLKLSAQNTALLLLLPYSVLWLYFSWQEKKQRLEDLTKGQATPDTSKGMFSFHDEKGVMRFSVKIDNLLYIEAADNYVNIYYLNNERVTRFMLRNSLKNLEELMKGTEVVRCHRRYMVNCSRVRVIRREKEGVVLELDCPTTTDLPVTKTFMENVMRNFSDFASSSEE